MSTIALAWTSSKLKRVLRFSTASSGVLEERMMCTTSSILSQATMSASSIWARSCAFAKSNFVLRIVTSCLCSTKCLMQSLSVRSFGRPLTRAMQFTENELCNAVILNNLFKMTFAFASRLTSTTMRIPWRPDSSLTLVMPSIFFSVARSAIYFTRSALFTP